MLWARALTASLLAWRSPEPVLHFLAFLCVGAFHAQYFILSLPHSRVESSSHHCHYVAAENEAQRGAATTQSHTGRQQKGQDDHLGLCDSKDLPPLPQGSLFFQGFSLSRHV